MRQLIAKSLALRTLPVVAILECFPFVYPLFKSNLLPGEAARFVRKKTNEINTPA